jgi:hypothetical protein
MRIAMPFRVLLVASMVFAAVAMASCAIPSPTLRLESVESLNLKEAPGLIQRVPAAIPGDLANARVLRVRMSSDVDVIAFSKAYGLQVGLDTYLCEGARRLGPLRVSSKYVRVEDGWIEESQYDPRKNLETLRGPDGRIQYFAIVPLNGAEMKFMYGPPSSHLGYDWPVLYDYVSELSDLCVIFRGDRLGIPSGFASPPVVVPREAILQAIRRPMQ